MPTSGWDMRVQREKYFAQDFDKERESMFGYPRGLNTPAVELM